MEREARTPTTPTYSPQEWDNGTFTIQHWLERAAWRNLQGTRYGVSPSEAPPSPLLWDDPLLAQVYKLDIATFIAAERVSVQCISGLVRLAPDETTMTHLASQTLDEARHYEVFCRRMADLDVTPAQRDQIVARYTTPAMRRFFDLILEQVDKRDFAAATLALNIILEGMAYPVYRYERAYWSKLDPGLSQIIHGAFLDEVAHVGFGEAYLRSLSKDVRVCNRLRSLAHDFHRLMIEVFDAVIVHYIGLYQEAANQYLELTGDVLIFPGKKIRDLSEAEQVQILKHQVEREYLRRMRNIGIPTE